MVPRTPSDIACIGMLGAKRELLPYSRTGYRCLVDGVYLRREKEKGYARRMGKSFGGERELTL